jgi:hypothetical protein
MHKKLMMACMAIAAFAAFVIAPAASASPVLTDITKIQDPNGGPLTEVIDTLSVGASITGKNINGVTKFTGGFGVECEVAHLKGTVTKNTGTSFAGTIPVGSATFTNAGGAACSSLLGPTTVKVTSEVCLESIPKTDELTVDGCLVNNVTQPVTFDLTAGGITCKYSANTLKGSFTTGSDVAKLKEQAASEEEPRQFFCPDTGSLDMEFTVTTTDGTPVTVS